MLNMPDGKWKKPSFIVYGLSEFIRNYGKVAIYNASPLHQVLGDDILFRLPLHLTYVWLKK